MNTFCKKSAVQLLMGIALLCASYVTVACEIKRKGNQFGHKRTFIIRDDGLRGDSSSNLRKSVCIREYNRKVTQKVPSLKEAVRAVRDTDEVWRIEQTYNPDIFKEKEINYGQLQTLNAHYHAFHNSTGTAYTEAIRFISKDQPH